MIKTIARMFNYWEEQSPTLFKVIQNSNTKHHKIIMFNIQTKNYLTWKKKVKQKTGRNSVTLDRQITKMEDYVNETHR